MPYYIFCDVLTYDNTIVRIYFSIVVNINLDKSDAIKKVKSFFSGKIQTLLNKLNVKGKLVNITKNLNAGGLSGVKLDNNSKKNDPSTKWALDVFKTYASEYQQGDEFYKEISFYVEFIDLPIEKALLIGSTIAREFNQYSVLVLDYKENIGYFIDNDYYNIDEVKEDLKKVRTEKNLPI